jgi:hypothetical protein
MEPFITANPLGITDLTGCALRDIGWTGTRCPDNGVPPVAQSQTVNGTQGTALQITLLGTDGSNTNALTYSIVTQPARGTLAPPPTLSSAIGVVFTYTPTGNLTGADSFSFQVSNGLSTSNVATVTVNIAAAVRPPVANAQTVSATAGTAQSITLTGSDPGGAPLTYIIVTNPTNGALTGTAPNLSYMANSGFTGTDSFAFRVNDGTLNSANATVTITVTAPAAVVSNSGGGGGGAMSDWTLAALLTLLASRLWAPLLGRNTWAAPKWGKMRGR